MAHFWQDDAHDIQNQLFNFYPIKAANQKTAFEKILSSPES